MVGSSSRVEKFGQNLSKIEIYNRLQMASAYSWVLALPPRSPVRYCCQRC